MKVLVVTDAPPVGRLMALAGRDWPFSAAQKAAGSTVGVSVGVGAVGAVGAGSSPGPAAVGESAPPHAARVSASRAAVVLQRHEIPGLSRIVLSPAFSRSREWLRACGADYRIGRKVCQIY